MERSIPIAAEVRSQTVAPEFSLRLGAGISRGEIARWYRRDAPLRGNTSLHVSNVCRSREYCQLLERSV